MTPLESLFRRAILFGTNFLFVCLLFRSLCVCVCVSGRGRGIDEDQESPLSVKLCGLGDALVYSNSSQKRGVPYWRDTENVQIKQGEEKTNRFLRLGSISSDEV